VRALALSTVFEDGFNVFLVVSGAALAVQIGLYLAARRR